MLHVSIQRNNKNVSPHQKAEGIYEKIAKSFYFSVILFSVACYATLSSFLHLITAQTYRASEAKSCFMNNNQVFAQKAH